jgi:hypothetical protein
VTVAPERGELEDANNAVTSIYTTRDRDELRQRICAATLRRYSWLARDPRPFPKEKPLALLDHIAADLTELRQYEYSLIELLPRIGDPQEKTKIRKIKSENCSYCPKKT